MSKVNVCSGSDEGSFIVDDGNSRSGEGKSGFRLGFVHIFGHRIKEEFRIVFRISGQDNVCRIVRYF